MKLKITIKQLKHEKNTNDTAQFRSHNKNLKTISGQPVCNRSIKMGQTERVCRQSSYSQQHSTKSYNNQVISRNVYNMRWSPFFNSRGNPNNQFTSSK